MMVATDPISIAIESETRFRRARIPMNAAVLLINDIQLVMKALIQLNRRTAASIACRSNQLYSLWQPFQIQVNNANGLIGGALFHLLLRCCHGASVRG